MMSCSRAKKVANSTACWFAMCSAVALLVGCAGTMDEDGARHRVDDVFNAPAFLTGAAGAFLTNSGTFGANVEIVTADAHQAPKTGKLLGRESRLLYAPETKKPIISRKHGAESTTFIWDVADAKGYVVNEALQGYAPISSTTKIKSVALNDVASVSDTINGYSCRRSEGIVTADDGTTAEFTIWRATELKGFPVRIKSRNGQFTLNLTKVRFDPVPSEMFLPPDGFSKHASASAMMGELLERELTSKKKPVTDWQETHPEPGDMRNTRTPY